ncbi:hypothetical protein [Pseudorhodobacter sp.]|uniref:hypothetical protein n=1 Tax=Pseudorhodobacter sp. TaxID=1934400 RepID=UPI002AFDF4DE|nr:hypothetical protein [Pseudorhodobacter sp.]
MTIECTIRFKNEPRAAIERALGSILLTTEADTAQGLMGGFFFKTDRSPTAILAAFEEDGFEFADFENIEFRTI